MNETDTCQDRSLAAVARGAEELVGWEWPSQVGVLKRQLSLLDPSFFLQFLGTGLDDP